MESAVVVEQRCLGKDTGSKIYPMARVLRRCQDNFTRFEIAGIEVHSPSRMLRHFAPVPILYPLYREFEIGESFRRGQRLKRNESPQQPRTHFFFVESGETPEENFTADVDRTKDCGQVRFDGG